MKYFVQPGIPFRSLTLGLCLTIASLLTIQTSQLAFQVRIDRVAHGTNVHLDLAKSIQEHQKLLNESCFQTTVPANVIPPLSAPPPGHPFEVDLTPTGSNSSKVAVFFGDSHAGHWHDCLKEMANQLNWTIHLRWEGACPAMIVPMSWWNHYDREAQEGLTYECNKKHGQWMDLVKKVQPDFVFVTAFAGHPPHWTWNMDTLNKTRLAYPEYIRNVTEASEKSRVVIIGDTPHFPDFVQGCMNKGDPRQCAAPRSKVIREDYHAMERDIALANSAIFIDPTDLFCTPTTCPGLLGNIIMFYDQDHMLHEFVRYICPLFTDLITTSLVVNGDL